MEKYKTISQPIATHGAFLADQTGMGKTILISFFISWLFENGVTPKGLSKPTLIVCPALLVESWAKEIMTKFRNLKVGVLYMQMPISSKPSDSQIKASLPGSLDIYRVSKAVRIS